ncbi:peptide/nickel transport system ATP-binding protein [Mycetocola sp. CAN_C7]|uniref:dipeptide ABC transporter ATP-binding protein n=1 Tax=Mycetocola sp. CAN_C7 TaxID=2787724 RepID=UPI0018C8F1B2
MTELLDVAGLQVAFGAADASTTVVHDLSLGIGRGECVAIVGESGSGKSVTARSLLGLAGRTATVNADRLRIAGQDRSISTEREWRRVRGRDVGLVLQDALVSLDPLRPIGREIADTLRLHRRMTAAAATTHVHELLERVGMPDPARAARQRAGELSGGLRQRALIASAIALDPPLLIADEPTTALDVSIQARILALMTQLKRSGTGILLISHDLAVVSAIADRVIVLRNGRVVESGLTSTVLTSPATDYTRELIAAVPSGRPRGVALLDPGTEAASRAASVLSAPFPAEQAPVLRGTSLVKTYPSPAGRFRAVDDVSFEIRRGETLGLVGESGSGKTTVARLALALTAADAGTVTLDGVNWLDAPERERRPLRRRIGAIYQDALSSFDPRFRVGRILEDAIGQAPPEHRESVDQLLDSVGLPRDIAGSRPLHLSGGQRQRVAIARALAAAPEVLICDEPVSALDVTIQAQVLDLLDGLQRERGLGYLFISHDLGVIRHMSDRIAVMQRGRIVESGPTASVLDDPQHPYTAQLVRDTPTLSV